MENKETVIHFNKWLFDNKIVPNSSFLWFDYTLSRDEVQFFELEELFDTFIAGQTIKDLASKKSQQINEALRKWL